MEWVELLLNIREQLIQDQEEFCRNPKNFSLNRITTQINNFFMKYIGFLILHSKFKKNRKMSSDFDWNLTGLFKKANNAEKIYRIDEDFFIRELTSEFNGRNELLPEIFKDKIENKEHKEHKENIYVNNEIIQKFEDLEKIGIKIDISEGFLGNHPDNDSKFVLTPIFLDYFYQKIILNEEKEKSHSGSYFSPSADVFYSLVTAFYYIFEKNFRQNETNYAQFINTGKKPLEILKRIVTEVIIPKKNEQSYFAVLDPACGSGTFLVYFLQLIKEIFRKDEGLKDVLKRIKMYGCDIRELALKITNFRVWCATYDIVQGNIDLLQKFMLNSLKLVHGDFLLQFSEQVPEKIKFNLIIGNPPYIRHRNIRDMRNPPQFNPAGYRHQLSLFLSDFKEKYKILFSNRMDYSLYFFLQSFKLLNSKGLIAFITSNSWMNVKYGYGFQEFLLKYSQIWQIADNSTRSFEYAEINTVLTFLSKNHNPLSEKLNSPYISFVRWKKPFHSLNIHKIMEFLRLSNISSKINENSENSPNFINLNPYNTENKLKHYSKFVFNHNNFHLILIPQFSVYSWNSANPNIDDKSEHIYFQSNKTNLEPKYQGYNWANYFFHAPSSYFYFRSLFSSKLTNLSQYVEVSRGITTNCNDFFVLTKVSKNLYQNGYGDMFELEPEVIRPFLLSPRQAKSPLIDESELKTSLFFTNLSKPQLKSNGLINAIKYIKYGEQKQVTIKKGVDRGKKIVGIHNLSSFRHRYQKNPDTWYCLKPKSSNTFFSKTTPQANSKIIYIQKIYHDIYRIIQTSPQIIANNTFYKLSPKIYSIDDEDLIFNLLLSSFTPYSLELHGRINFGGGALDTATFDIGKILILKLEFLTIQQKAEINDLAKKISHLKFLPLRIDILREEKINLDEKIFSFLETPFTLSEFYQDLLELQAKRINKKTGITKE